MKKVLLAAIVLTIAHTGFSQIRQDQWLVGGTAGFASAKQGSGSKNTTINISPSIGYFFVDHLAGGIRASFESDKPDGLSSTTSFAIAPFVRYYFLPTEQKVNIFADGQYGFGSIKSSGGASAGINEFAISAGPAIFLSPNTALEFGVMYSSFGGKYYGSERANTIGLTIGFQIHLGNGIDSKK